MSRSVLITMGFIIEAAGGKPTERLSPATVEKHEGAMGVMGQLAYYASCTDEFLDKRSDIDFPGVFYYEVLPDLIDWALTNQLPVYHDFHAELTRRFNEWIEDAKVAYEVSEVDDDFEVHRVSKRGANKEWIASCKDKTTADILVTALSA